MCCWSEHLVIFFFFELTLLPIFVNVTEEMLHLSFRPWISSHLCCCFMPKRRKPSGCWWLCVSACFRTTTTPGLSVRGGHRHPNLDRMGVSRAVAAGTLFQSQLTKRDSGDASFLKWHWEGMRKYRHWTSRSPWRENAHAPPLQSVSRKHLMSCQSVTRESCSSAPAVKEVVQKHSERRE